jgi:hypothetical protein
MTCCSDSALHGPAITQGILSQLNHLDIFDRSRLSFFRFSTIDHQIHLEFFPLSGKQGFPRRTPAGNLPSRDHIRRRTGIQARLIRTVSGETQK